MKKTMLCATVLALSVAATGCASGKKAESSAASTAAAQTEAASTTAAGKTAETTATAAAASDMAVPGYAPGQIPEIPAIVLPELGISENPAAKITLDKTKALSSVPGITVTPVRVENNQIQRGSTVMQLGSNGEGQYKDGNLTVQTDGNGAGQYVDAERGITIQRDDDGSGQYLDSKLGISLLVDDDGAGSYKDDRYGISLMVDDDGEGLYTNTQNGVTVTADDDAMSYRAGKVKITQKKDGSGSYSDAESGLKIENDGKGKATVTKGTQKATVDAAPLGTLPRLPRLGAVPAVPSLEANSLLITLDSGVLFDVDKYDLRPEAQETLNQLAKLLTEAGITAFEIDGHTDSNADDAYNQTLSENRANAVKEYLKAQGVTAEITTQGYGESRPVATNETAEGRQQNRRVEIIIPTV
ncbi:OmpA family protein [Stomatobaculum longum]|jgi:ompA family membrane protein|uniref:OmpA family protein n=1 Tax=Stomatobaculum longum TaxID=796942 RepID=UPI0028DBFD11|nr:OmpA family protein [Stomatobaculum longum]